MRVDDRNAKGHEGKVNSEQAVAYRKQCATLLEAVLDETVSARSALNTWPMAGNRDTSVQCAYTMLWYFEADEDRHHVEMFYADVQLKTMQEAAALLKMGQPLSYDIIRMYQGRLGPSEYLSHKAWQEPFVRLYGMWRQLVGILETSPHFRRRL